jgi:hypothetical protein
LQAMANTPRSPFRLQVNWINHNGEICNVFVRVCEATVSWKQYSSQVTAPPCAEMAHIYASAQSSEWVWLDSFDFSGLENEENASPSENN